MSLSGITAASLRDNLILFSPFSTRSLLCWSTGFGRGPNCSLMKDFSATNLHRVRTVPQTNQIILPSFDRSRLHQLSDLKESKRQSSARFVNCSNGTCFDHGSLHTSSCDENRFDTPCGRASCGGHAASVNISPFKILLQRPFSSTHPRLCIADTRRLY